MLIPLAWSGAGSAFEVCVCAERDAASGRYQVSVLEQAASARVYLACLRDRAGNVCQWLELLVQNTDVMASAALDRPLTNRDMDEQWDEMVGYCRKGAGGKLLWTGWEDCRLPPLVVDCEKKQSSPLLHPGGGVLSVCDDETVLSTKELDSYTGTAGRYLWTGNAQDDMVIASGVMLGVGELKEVGELVRKRQRAAF